MEIYKETSAEKLLKIDNDEIRIDEILGNYKLTGCPPTDSEFQIIYLSFKNQLINIKEIGQIVFDPNVFANISDKQYFFCCFYEFINQMESENGMLIHLVEKIIAFLSVQDIFENFPKESIHLLVCLLKKNHNLFSPIFGLLNDKFVSNLFSFDFLINIIKEDFFNNKKYLDDLNTISSMYNKVISNISILEIQDQIQVLKSFKRIIQIEPAVISKIAQTNFKILICHCVDCCSINTISITFEIFSIIHSIEIQNECQFENIWIQIFAFLSFLKYKKLFLTCINDSEPTVFVSEIFFLNFNNYRILLFDENCFKLIKKLQIALITEFQNICAGNKANILRIIQFLLKFSKMSLISEFFISNVIDCFALENEIFPQFILDLIEKSDRNGDENLKKVLISNQIVDQCFNYK